jgi:hypothetical protein
VDLGTIKEQSEIHKIMARTAPKLIPGKHSQHVSGKRDLPQYGAGGHT